MAKRDFYEILGVAKDADVKVIKKAFRKMGGKLHPDRQKGKTEAEKEQAAAGFQEAVEAQEVLTDSKKRAVYDEYGHQGLEGYDSNSGISGSDYQAPAKKHTWNSTMSFFDDDDDKEDDTLGDIKSRMKAMGESKPSTEGEENMTPGQRRRARMKAKREAAVQEKDNIEERAQEEPEEDTASKFNTSSSRETTERVILVSLPLDLVQNTIDILQTSGQDNQANELQTALSSAPRKMDTRLKF